MCGGEPNGGMVENCAQLVNIEESGGLVLYNDLACYRQDQPHICQDIGEIVITIRGICKNSLMDTSFSMVEGDINGKRFFAGTTGWKIFWDSKREMWELSSSKKENMFGLHTEDSSYPLGKNFWQIVNDSSCSYRDPQQVLLNISPCNSSSFTCDDGTCVPMTLR